MWPDDEDYIAELDGVDSNQDDWADFFASAGEAGTATTPKSGVVHEHAVANGETPNPGSRKAGAR